MKLPPIIAAFTSMKASRYTTSNGRGRWNFSEISIATVMTSRIAHVTQYSQ
jgi:hypothetical protein